jgi:hypothetical protein
MGTHLVLHLLHDGIRHLARLQRGGRLLHVRRVHARDHIGHHHVALVVRVHVRDDHLRHDGNGRAKVRKREREERFRGGRRQRV